jgi:hypothetical protein
MFVRWMRRVAIALLVVVSLFVSLLLALFEPPEGIVVFVVVATYIAGETWLARNSERHPTAAAIWKVAWHFSVAGLFTAFGVVHFGLPSILFFVLGAWSLAMGLLTAAALLIERRRGAERR